MSRVLFQQVHVEVLPVSTALTEIRSSTLHEVHRTGQAANFRPDHFFPFRPTSLTLSYPVLFLRLRLCLQHHFPGSHHGINKWYPRTERRCFPTTHSLTDYLQNIHFRPILHSASNFLISKVISPVPAGVPLAPAQPPSLLPNLPVVRYF